MTDGTQLDSPVSFPTGLLLPFTKVIALQPPPPPKLPIGDGGGGSKRLRKPGGGGEAVGL